MIFGMSKLLAPNFFINSNPEYCLLEKIIEDKYKGGIAHVFKYMETLLHMKMSNDRENMMGYDSYTKKCFFYNKVECLYSMIVFGMRQRYLVYKLDMWFRKKFIKVVYINDNDLYLNNCSTQKVITVREDGNYYRFTKMDLCKIWMSSLKNIVEGIPQPKTPLNPYTRKEFNIYQLSEMYRFLGEPKHKLVTLFKLSHFDINNFEMEWYGTIVREMLIDKVKEFSSRKLFHVIRHMCKVLGVNVPSNTSIKNYLTQYGGDITMYIVQYYEFDMNIIPTIEEFTTMRARCKQLSNNISVIGKQLIKRHRVGCTGNSIYNSMMQDDLGVESGDSTDEDELEDLRIQEVSIE